METTEQIVREAPDIEAYKLGLLKQAKSLSDQPVGVLQFDQTGQPIMETYQYVDAEGNTQTGTRQQRMLPPQLVAEMSGLQKRALEGAQAGIGNYLPYLEDAGYTLGDAQSATWRRYGPRFALPRRGRGFNADGRGKCAGRSWNINAGH
jgi:hypothetical protein